MCGNGKGLCGGPAGQWVQPGVAEDVVSAGPLCVPPSHLPGCPPRARTLPAAPLPWGAVTRPCLQVGDAEPELGAADSWIGVVPVGEEPADSPRSAKEESFTAAVVSKVSVPSSNGTQAPPGALSRDGGSAGPLC